MTRTTSSKHTITTSMASISLRGSSTGAWMGSVYIRKRRVLGPSVVSFAITVPVLPIYIHPLEACDKALNEGKFGSDKLSFTRSCPTVVLEEMRRSTCCRSSAAS